MSAEDVTLADVLDYWRRDHAADLHVAIPARVESYDGAKQTAVVKPMVRRVMRTADEERLVDSLPPVHALVQWPRGGHYFLQLPIAPGDSGLLVFCEADIGGWYQTAQDVDPGDERRHSLAGAVFFPGLETVARALAAVDHLVLGHEGGPGVHVKASTVELGAEGGNFVALANLVGQQLADLKSAISGWTPVPNDGGAALKVALTTWVSSSSAVAATITKAT